MAHHPPPTLKKRYSFEKSSAGLQSTQSQTTSSLETMVERVCKLENPPKSFRLGVNTKAQGNTMPEAASPEPVPLSRPQPR